MPHIISEKLYPKLPIEDEVSNGLSQKIYPQLFAENKILNDKDKDTRKIYLAINYPKNNFLEKRKLVCIVLHEGKLNIKKYNHEEFEKQVNFREGQVSLNHDLVQLVLYVKKSEQNKCFEEVTEILKTSCDVETNKTISTIRNHFNTACKNIGEFINYGEMKHFFDEPGEYTQILVTNLNNTFDTIDARYNEYKKNYNENDKFTDILNEMKKIVDEMKVIYNKNKIDLDHLIKSTVETVTASFNNLVEKFDEKNKKLDLINLNIYNQTKLDQLEKNSTQLKEACEAIIPSGSMATEEMFEKKKQIKNDVDILLTLIQSLKDQDNIDSAIEGLEKKKNELQEKFVNLKTSINIFQMPITNKINTRYEQLNKVLEEGIQPILGDIKNHAAKTSESKKIILNKILTYLKDIKDKIIANNSSNEIKDIIEKVKDFINFNLSELAISRGFFSNSGKSASLMEMLKRELNKLENEITNENDHFFTLKK